MNKISNEWRCFFGSIVAVFVFYFPLMKDGAVNSGVLYAGDVLGYYLPAIIKTHALISAGSITGAIDYSLFGGSSDFFLSPNFFAYHPLLVLYCLLAPAGHMALHTAGLLLVALLAVHSLVACYFSMRLLTRFFSFEVEASFLVALGFAFSYYMVNAMTQPPFLFCASVAPWAAYSVLCFVESPSFRILSRAMLPIMFGILGGYLPVGVASLGVSGLLVLSHGFVFDDERRRLIGAPSLLARSLTPYVAAFLALSPFLYAVYAFHASTGSSSVPNLFYSAHQMSEIPQGLLRIISTHLIIPSKFHEFGLVWGLTPIVVLAVFIFNKAAPAALSAREWRLAKVSATIYFISVLAIFGEFSAVSDMVFYFVPQVGKMHIYQRFLLITHISFLILIALLLKAVITSPTSTATRAVIFVMAAMTCWIAVQTVNRAELFAGVAANNSLIFEFFLATLFACSLLVPDKRFVFVSAAILSALPALNQVYDLVLAPGSLEVVYKRQPAVLDGKERTRLLTYLERFKGKDVIKYVDVTPMWTTGGYETFSKVYPYFLLPHPLLSSYGGFTFYLSARADYIERMPVRGLETAVKPDWDYVHDTGADFVVALAEDVAKNDLLARLKSKARPEDIYQLQNGSLIIPFPPPDTPAPILYDNGHFRLLPEGFDVPPDNLALGKTARQSSTVGNGVAERAIDGVTDGNFAAGSVTHTGLDPNAWLDIDLGESQRIDAIRLWNRTDCCGYRMENYWVFVSDTPFAPSDTAAGLRKRPDVWGQAGALGKPSSTIRAGGITGRFVRVQFGDQPPQADSFLNLAEVEVLRYNRLAKSGATDVQVRDFTTNFGSKTRLRLVNSEPVVAQYLFASNPKVHFLLNGTEVAPTLRNGVSEIRIPPGRNSLEVRYVNWPLRMFVAFMAAFTVFWVWSHVPERTASALRRMGQFPLRFLKRKS